jgi:hypothetical protein
MELEHSQAEGAEDKAAQPPAGQAAHPHRRRRMRIEHRALRHDAGERARQPRVQHDLRIERTQNVVNANEQKRVMRIAAGRHVQRRRELRVAAGEVHHRRIAADAQGQCHAARIAVHRMLASTSRA